MSSPSRLSEAFRLQEIERGRRSLFYFMTAILGFTAEDLNGEPYLPDLHRDFCAFLEGRAPHYPWTEAVVCGARGIGKSVVVRAYILWRVLYIVNFSVLFVSSTFPRARELFFPILALLTTGPRAEYIRWLYSHRFPPSLEGTSSERLRLVQTDPLRNAAIIIAGRETSLESIHPDLIVGDDIEGFEAEKSTASNDEAWDVWERVRPLRRDPVRAQLLLLGTPWGDNPLVWRLRDFVSWNNEEDNATSSIKFWWRPIRDRNGKSIWPERFPEAWIDNEKKRAYAHKQLFLGRGGAGETFFDMKEVVSAFYTWAGPRRDLLRYRSFEFDPNKLTEDGMVVPEVKDQVVHISRLRFYLHFDPKHRAKSNVRRKYNRKDRPADAAIAVVGVAPDFHPFAVDHWIDRDAGLLQQCQELMRFYRKYEPSMVTFEGVGAQIWLVSFIEQLESTNPSWRRPISTGLFGAPAMLPRLSRRLHEDTSKSNESKADAWREGLSPWVNLGVVHFREDQGEFITQMANAQDENQAVDLLDCLAQGPAVWKPAAYGELYDRFSAARRFVQSLVSRRPTSTSRGIDRTGWQDPGWRSQR